MEEDEEVLGPGDIMGGGSMPGAGETLDTVNPDMVPYLLHFSREGLVPELRNFDAAGPVTTEEIEGERLGDLLEIMDSVDPLESIYRELGESAGYIFGNFPVSHGDLSVHNVVVDYEEDFPYIVDWETGGYGMGIAGEDPDSTQLLASTRGKLEKTGRLEWYEVLEEAYTAGFETGEASDPELTPRELEAEYAELLDSRGF